MLRTLVIALALGFPGIASAQDQFRESAIGAEVVSDNGAVVGRVDHVVRDRNGRIVATEIASQEPESAPYASRELVASAADRNSMILVSDRRDDRRASLQASTQSARRAR